MPALSSRAPIQGQWVMVTADNGDIYNVALCARSPANRHAARLARAVTSRRDCFDDETVSPCNGRKLLTIPF
ncbi:unnamed protein product, partial [Iphiclides podalirius]